MLRLTEPESLALRTEHPSIFANSPSLCIPDPPAAEAASTDRLVNAVLAQLGALDVITTTSSEAATARHLPQYETYRVQDLVLRWQGPANLSSPLQWSLEGRDYLLEQSGMVTCLTYEAVQWPAQWRQTLPPAQPIITNGGQAKDRQEFLVQIHDGLIPIHPSGSWYCIPEVSIDLPFGSYAILRSSPTSSDFVKIGRNGDTISFAWFRNLDDQSPRQTSLSIDDWRAMQTSLFRLSLCAVCHMQDGRPAARISVLNNCLKVGLPNGVVVTTSWMTDTGGGRLGISKTATTVTPTTALPVEEPATRSTWLLWGWKQIARLRKQLTWLPEQFVRPGRRR